MRKVFSRVLITTLIALLTIFSGCEGTVNYKVADPYSFVVQTEQNGEGTEDNVGLYSGFKLGYDAGFADNDENSKYLFDDRYYYFNQIRTVSADPGTMFVSKEQAEDSYNKLLTREKEVKASAFDITEFESKYGTKEEWLAEYSDIFVMVVTGSNSSLSSNTKQEYAQVTEAMYPLYVSKDLSNWKLSGRLDGYAVMLTADCWATSFCSWAPEIVRDPISGLFMVVGSTGIRVGETNAEYPTEYVSDWDRLTLAIAISETPIGPYRIISADEYYSYLAEYNDDGSVKTVTQEINGEQKQMSVYRKDVSEFLGKSEENAILTEYKNDEFYNKNGNSVTVNTPPINIAYYHEKIKEIYPNMQEGFGTYPAIDINPLIDSKGDLYMYFSMHTSSAQGGNRVWVIKMKDWVSPQWDTLTHVASPSASTVYTDGVNSETISVNKYTKNPDGTKTKETVYVVDPIVGIQGYQHLNETGVNEGAHVIEKDGFYYLTYSPFGYGSRGYAIYMAIANNPFGPFVKIKEFSPIIGIDGESGDYMSGTGHHSFVWAGNELFAVYHCFLNASDNTSASGSFLERAIAFDRVGFYDYDGITFGDIVDEHAQQELEKNVGKDYMTKEWIESVFVSCNNSFYHGKDATDIYNKDKVVPILYGNGPTRSLQPLPEVAFPDGLTNVADKAKLEVIYGDETTAKYTTDRLVTYQKWSREYEVVGDEAHAQLKIKLSWDTPQAIRNVMVYNSRAYEYAFRQVRSIVFKLSDKPSWYPSNVAYNGYCHIRDLKVDPYSFNTDNQAMRKGGSAMATFNEIVVSEIIITISAKDKVALDMLTGANKNIVKVSEIFILGKDAHEQA